MPIFWKTADQCPDLEVLADMESVIDARPRFRPIAAFGLKVDVLLASADDDKPALSRNGSHPDAYIKVNTGELRARGLGDVTVYIDADRHRDKTVRQRQATLAHELYHVEIQTHRETTIDDDGRDVLVTRPDLDDYDRPVVKLIPDDWTVTGFREVAEWYGDDSCEVKSYRAMGRLLAQAVMPFMEDRGDEEGDEAPDLEAVLGATARGRSLTGATS